MLVTLIAPCWSFDQRLADVEAESGAGNVGAVAELLDPVELVEDARQVGWLYAHAVVRNGNGQAAVVVADSDLDGPVGRLGELEGVVYEIVNDLPLPGLVADSRGKVAIDVERDRRPGCDIASSSTVFCTKAPRSNSVRSITISPASMRATCKTSSMNAAKCLVLSEIRCK